MIDFKQNLGTVSLFLLVLVSIVITSCSSGELIPVYHAQRNESMYDWADVKFDPEIPEAFNSQSEVAVLMRLNDNSNILITGTKEQISELQRQRNEWFKPVIDDVLATIPESEIRAVNKRFNGFSCYITEQGFEILLQNPNVREIIKSSLSGGGIANEEHDN